MIRQRPTSTTSTAPSRRFSNNNPFRNASADLLQLDPQETDSELRSWVASNTVTQPNYLNRRTGSQNSRSNSIPENGHYIVPSPKRKELNSYSMGSPPPPAGSNNPFLDDLEASSVSSSDVSGGTQSVSANSYKHNSAEHNYRNHNERKPYTGEGPGPNSRGRNDRAGPYLSAQEEKEQLRRAYVEDKQTNGREDDLPPAYEEVARPSRASSGYPVDKKGDPRYRPSSSSGKAHHGQGSVSSSSRSRQHSKSGGDHKGPYGHVKDRSKRGTSAKERKGSKAPLPKNVDTIDKMDVTGLFGGAFHHDGPFDACTPHRNQNKKVAPVLAFPKDGPNSSLSGPSKAPSARDQVFGLEDDDSYLYRSANSGRKSANSSNNTLDAIKPHQEVTQFDAKVKADLVHGPTTQGLGSTTFLDGAPAAPVAIEEAMHRQNTVGRKKSLSQRLGRSPPVAQQSAGLSGSAGNHAARRNGNLKLIKTHSGHLESDDPKADDDELYLGANYDNDMRKPSSGNKFLRRVKSLKVNRRG